ncbi:MAG: GspE/PulE family protein, partial [Gammaproteobacteria bacterium]
LSFASGLRALVRQDPDIIMVGEMRDLETAEIGIKAAQTGHLVLSTLHTNSAAETLTRLINMGVAPYNIATSITLVIAQRLIRKLCPLCTQNNLPIGCDNCHQGYKGRTGIYEFLPITPDISNAILHGKSAPDIHTLALQAGMQSLQDSALKKVQVGITSLVEIHRVA